MIRKPTKYAGAYPNMLRHAPTSKWTITGLRDNTKWNGLLNCTKSKLELKNNGDNANSPKTQINIVGTSWKVLFGGSHG